MPNMSSRNITTFARWYFQNIQINFANAGEILGTANLKEMIEFVMLDIGRIASGMKKQKETVVSVSKDSPVVKFVVDEIEAFIVAEGVVVKNRVSLVSLLQKQLKLAKKQKSVLPECRCLNHFEIGDDVMINVGYYIKNKPNEMLVRHDWVPAKILHTGATPICHSNQPYSRNGYNGGHYYATPNENYVFKRQDFYKLRKMIKNGSDLQFLRLLPKNIRGLISNGTVYPMSDKRLAKEQGKIIRTAYNTVDTLSGYYHDNIKIIAKKHKVKLPKRK